MATEVPTMSNCERIIQMLLGIGSLMILIAFCALWIVGNNSGYKGDHPPLKDPTFTVESTTVNSYNLTSDSRIFTIIDLGIRARNPNPTNSCYFFDFHDMLVQVTKGRRDNVMAQGSLRNFGLCTNNETLFHVEAVGMSHDMMVGYGRVNVSLTGHVGVYWNLLDVMCVDVRVNVSRSTSWYQKVDCNVTLLDQIKQQEFPGPGLVDDCLLYSPPS